MRSLTALAAEAAGELDVPGKDGDTFAVEGAEVGVLEEANKVDLRDLLKGKDGGTLPGKVGPEDILADLTDKALEGALAQEELGGPLVPADLAKGYSSGPKPVGLLDAAFNGGGLTSSLGGELLPGGLASH